MNIIPLNIVAHLGNITINQRFLKSISNICVMFLKTEEIGMSEKCFKRRFGENEIEYLRMYETKVE